jgi:hypothetical protein
MNPEQPRIPSFHRGVVATAYGIAFFLPVMGRDLVGWQAFWMAWFPPYWAFAGLSWFANVAIWVGLYQLGQGKRAAAAKAGAWGVFLAISSPIVWQTLWTGLTRCNGEFMGPGYWAWLGSMALLTLSGCSHSLFCERRLDSADEFLK